MVIRRIAMHSSFPQPFRVARKRAADTENRVHSRAVSTPTKTLFHRLSRYCCHTAR